MTVTEAERALAADLGMSVPHLRWWMAQNNQREANLWQAEKAKIATVSES